MADSDTLTMPPASLDDEEQRRRLAVPAPGMPPATFAGTPAPGSLQSQPSSVPGNVMPPAQVAQAGTPVPGTLKPEASSNGPSPIMPPAQVEVPKPQFGNMNAPPPRPPQLSGWRKYLDAIGSIFPIGRAIETAIPGTPQNFEEKETERQRRAEKEAEIRQKGALASQEESKAESLKKPPEKPEPRTVESGGVAYERQEDGSWKPIGTPKPTAEPKVTPGEGIFNEKTGKWEVPVPAKETKPGEYKPYAVPGSKTPILAAQQGDKLLTRDGKELPANAVPYEKPPQGAYGEPGGDLSKSGDAYLESLDPAERAIVSEIGTGRAAPERIAYVVARNPKLLAELALAFPDLDTAKLGAYVTTYRDFTSGPASVQINAGNTALLHLNELRKLNTDRSRIPGTADYQKYENKLDTISAELGRFYGNATIEGIAGYRKTLGAIFNRDAAIRTQAQSMGDKLDSFENQWRNAAPSKAYQAPLPGISEEAKKARAELDQNYKFQGKEAGAAKDYGPAQGKPDGATGTLPDGTKVVAKGGRIVAAQ